MWRAAALICLLAAPAWAQEFDRLPPQDQKIARALFEAQVPSRSGAAALSLDQIAGARAEAAWAQVLKRMQAAGLVAERTLAQVIERKPPARIVPANDTVVVTTGSGRSKILVR